MHRGKYSIPCHAKQTALNCCGTEEMEQSLDCCCYLGLVFLNLKTQEWQELCMNGILYTSSDINISIVFKTQTLILGMTGFCQRYCYCTFQRIIHSYYNMAANIEN